MLSSIKRIHFRAARLQYLSFTSTSNPQGNMLLKTGFR